MPQPSKVAPSEIWTTARRLLTAAGPDGLTMRALARELGVSAPALYFHVESREDLLRQLTSNGLLEFGAYLAERIAGEPGIANRLHLLADAYADFAFENPHLFQLLFGPCPEERLVDPAVAEQASAPLLDTLAEFLPPEEVLGVSQALWALAHGYATLALADQFRLGGQPRAALHSTIDLILGGLGLAGRESDQ